MLTQAHSDDDSPFESRDAFHAVAIIRNTLQSLLIGNNSDGRSVHSQILGFLSSLETKSVRNRIIKAWTRCESSNGAKKQDYEPGRYSKP